MNAPWYEIENISEYDSPCLVLYKDRIVENISRAAARMSDLSLLRPHVKTNKIAEVCAMMLEKGITKFKCATIAEAEMLASINAPDVLLAYQPVGPKIKRFISLILQFPATTFSCVVDDESIAGQLSKESEPHGLRANVFVDVNSGMNRTGAGATRAMSVIDAVLASAGLHLKGIHVYDGHIKERDRATRQQQSDSAFALVEKIISYAENASGGKMTVVAGGSPTFVTHLHREVECSPGTFVFWDWGYQLMLSEEPFQIAALVITRVISIVDEHTITTDLGYKAIASESPMPRVHFLNAPGLKQIMQSEEHLTLHVDDSSKFTPGDVLYGAPLHICPTVALYDEALVCEDNRIIDAWKVTARNRRITL